MYIKTTSKLYVPTRVYVLMHVQMYTHKYKHTFSSTLGKKQSKKGQKLLSGMEGMHTTT